MIVQVCVAWPVASFMSGRVGLQKCAQKNLRVKSGDSVTLHPITGPVLQAEEVLLSIRLILDLYFFKTPQIVVKVSFLQIVLMFYYFKDVKND